MSNTPIEFRAYTQAVRRTDGSRRIGGTCAPYNKPSRNLGAFIEVIETRAFARGLGMGFPGVSQTLSTILRHCWHRLTQGRLIFRTRRPVSTMNLSARKPHAARRSAPAVAGGQPQRAM